MFSRSLPDRIAIYLHAVEADERDRLSECLAWLNEQDYRFTNASDYCAPGDGRRVYLSFDDNFRSWVDLLPVLARHDARATFFVNTGVFRDREDGRTLDAYFDRIGHRGERLTLSTQELRELARAGHPIGCHTHSHFVLSRLPRERIPAEIDASARFLRTLLDVPVVDFSFPYGMRRHFSRSLRAYCAARFRTISNAGPGLQHAVSRPHSIHRSSWKLDRPLSDNLEDLRIDGRVFAGLTGRSPGI